MPKNLLEFEYEKLTDDDLVAELHRNFGPHSLIDTREQVQRWVLAEMERRLLDRVDPTRSFRPAAADDASGKVPVGPLWAEVMAEKPYDPVLLQGATEMPPWPIGGRDLTVMQEAAARAREAAEHAMAEEVLPVVQGGGIFGEAPVAFEASREIYAKRGVLDPDGWLTDERVVDPVRSEAGVFRGEEDDGAAAELLSVYQAAERARRRQRRLRWAICILAVAVAAMVAWAAWRAW